MFSFLKDFFFGDEQADKEESSGKRSVFNITLVRDFDELTRAQERHKTIPHSDGLFNLNSFSELAKNSDENPNEGIMNSYDTNTEEQTCSCTDWEKRRHIYPFNDPRRLCKHLIKQLDLHNLPEELKIYGQELLFKQKQGKGFITNIYSIIKVPDTSLVVVYKPDWCDVYDEQGNRYSMALYDYNHEEIIWTRGNKPKEHYRLELFFQDDGFQLPRDIEIDEIDQLQDFMCQTYESKGCYSFIVSLSGVAGTPAMRLYVGTVADDNDSEICGEVEVSNEYIIIKNIRGYRKHIFRRSELIKTKALKEKNRKIDKINRSKEIEVNYLKSKEILEEFGKPFTLQNFYGALKKQRMVRKEGYSYIAIGDGLQYAENVYGVVHWDRKKFKELLNLISDNSSSEERRRGEDNSTPSSSETCPQCQSSNTIFQDYKSLNVYRINSYRCLECGFKFKKRIEDK
jgi:DNA-directed RNA polymerase subunit M/transcription elongation factor TFIIS